LGRRKSRVALRALIPTQDGSARVDGENGQLGEMLDELAHEILRASRARSALAGVARVPTAMSGALRNTAHESSACLAVSPDPLPAILPPHMPLCSADAGLNRRSRARIGPCVVLSCSVRQPVPRHALPH